MNQENQNNPEQVENIEEVQNDSSATECPASEEVLSEGLENQQADTEEELKLCEDKYMRLIADFDNFKKRTSKERIELIQVANKDLMSALLEVLDDMDRADSQIQESDDVTQIKEGIQLVFGKLRKTLTDKGLKAFDSINQDFDVELHEAITEIPAPSEDMDGKVVDQVQKGYYLNDKLLRHAKVVVGKKQQ